jgi:hypothetical protein
LNLLSLFVTFLGYGLILAVYNGTGTTAQVFPTFDAPNVSFENIPSGCSGLTDCTEYVGKVIVNIALSVVYIVLLVVELVSFMVALFILITTNAFEGIEGVPAWFNALLLGIMGAATAIVIYKSIRSGETDAS